MRLRISVGVLSTLKKLGQLSVSISIKVVFITGLLLYVQYNLQNKNKKQLLQHFEKRLSKPSFLSTKQKKKRTWKQCDECTNFVTLSALKFKITRKNVFTCRSLHSNHPNWLAGTKIIFKFSYLSAFKHCTQYVVKQIVYNPVHKINRKDKKWKRNEKKKNTEKIFSIVINIVQKCD